MTAKQEVVSREVRSCEKVQEVVRGGPERRTRQEVVRGCRRERSEKEVQKRGPETGDWR